MSYDPAIVQSFADNLYRRAASIIASATVLGALLGFAVGAAVFPSVAALLAAGIGAAVGYSIGRERAFRLKLDAQVALCQVQIEKNTRKEINQFREF
jgi:Glycine zipper